MATPQAPILPEMSPWRTHPLTIPPDSRRAWIRLVVWEMLMGALICASVGAGIALISTASSHVVTVYDSSKCYTPSPPTPCERVLYRTGALNMAFTALCGLVLNVHGVWLMWVLWSAVQPKPITDDFLRALHDSFGRDWRRPSTWPWPQVAWAYGFTFIGAVSAAATALVLWASISSLSSPPAATPRVETSQTFILPR